MRSDVWKDDGDAAGVCWGRWRFVDIKKVVGSDVRRRPAKPGGRELAY